MEPIPLIFGCHRLDPFICVQGFSPSLVPGTCPAEGWLILLYLQLLSNTRCRFDELLSSTYASGFCCCHLPMPMDTVVVCTDLSGKKQHRQESVSIVVPSEKPTWRNG